MAFKDGRFCALMSFVHKTHMLAEGEQKVSGSGRSLPITSLRPKFLEKQGINREIFVFHGIYWDSTHVTP